MRFFIFIFFALVFLSGCKSGNLYEKESILLDSVKIVLQVKLNELKKSEQNMQNFQFQKFSNYYSFLKSNIGDTVKRPEANSIQIFINSGSTINEFNKGKTELIRQTETCIAQVQKLSSDLKHNSIQSSVAQSYFNSERGHAEELIKVIDSNIKALNLSLNSYKNSLTGTEEYIRRINNGVLPTVVTETE